jgi:hypothetical protein
LARNNSICTVRPYHALPCACEVFRIKKADADMHDFGDQVSTGDGEYGCLDSHFVPFKDVKVGTLMKYDITEDEYRTIQDHLEVELNVGSCGWCT